MSWEIRGWNCSAAAFSAWRDRLWPHQNNLPWDGVRYYIDELRWNIHDLMLPKYLKWVEMDWHDDFPGPRNSSNQDGPVSPESGCFGMFWDGCDHEKISAALPRCTTYGLWSRKRFSMGNCSEVGFQSVRSLCVWRYTAHAVFMA